MKKTESFSNYFNFNNVFNFSLILLFWNSKQYFKSVNYDYFNNPCTTYNFFYLRGYSNLFLLLFFFISIAYGLSNNIFLNIKNPYRVSKPLIENNSKIDIFLKNNKRISFSTDSYTNEFYKKILMQFLKYIIGPDDYIIDLSGTTLH